jgi:hypothetical protein
MQAITPSENRMGSLSRRFQIVDQTGTSAIGSTLVAGYASGMAVVVPAGDLSVQPLEHAEGIVDYTRKHMR